MGHWFGTGGLHVVEEFSVDEEQVILDGVTHPTVLDVVGVALLELLEALLLLLPLPFPLRPLGFQLVVLPLVAGLGDLEELLLGALALLAAIASPCEALLLLETGDVAHSPAGEAGFHLTFFANIAAYHAASAHLLGLASLRGHVLRLGLGRWGGLGLVLSRVLDFDDLLLLGLLGY